ncbi:ABC-type multidrug transport system ATPase subunit [Chryseobacterium sp. PvR013]|uniref:ATP-binding cassette domain-containing protein n=1 Tax=Chryseobacterium sp. PvR013 TaxID=2806595 RepID=UPI001AE5935B|nr:ATP-binding cassette domain-containing protein [Chryseobacterium sp. PvR013]MBP1167832.1 ABC-type multidrug transport system ATPase subunit [Chryseobacterium sp. PvR013]
MSKLHVDSLTKSFNERKILQDVYIGCETGQITGLLGRNGSGKSTLLKIIFGVISGDTQFIKCDNKVLKSTSDRKNRISYLPQDLFLPKYETVKNLIPLFCNKENTNLLFALEFIQPLLHEKIKNLSKGEQRIIETLMIIYSETDFVLLDEPFHSLSPKVCEELKKIILQQSKYKGFIISDHNYQDVLDISDHIYLLSDGHLKQIQDFKELQRYNYLPKSI